MDVETGKKNEAVKVTMDVDEIKLILSAMRLHTQNMTGMGMDWKRISAGLGCAQKMIEKLESDNRIMRFALKSISKGGTGCSYLQNGIVAHECKLRDTAKDTLDELAEFEK